jgi:hypothetical protein
MVAHTYNPSYSGGRDQEDHGWKAAWANNSRGTISNKTKRRKTKNKNFKQNAIDRSHYMKFDLICKIGRRLQTPFPQVTVRVIIERMLESAPKIFNVCKVL